MIIKSVLDLIYLFFLLQEYSPDKDLPIAQGLKSYNY